MNTAKLWQTYEQYIREQDVYLTDCVSHTLSGQKIETPALCNEIQYVTLTIFMFADTVWKVLIQLYGDFLSC